jgi:hypothetical protein
MSLGNVSLAVGPFYKPVPDVDKSMPLDPADNSCWQAAAANLLAGGGYGTGADAQARADSIYNQLTADLTKAHLGDTARAVNYWLYMYGKNPDSPEFQPNNPYTDVTTVNGATLGLADYNFLLDELIRCQYVAVSFNEPAPHTMTLVGGDPSGAFSYWHDSDKDVGNVPLPGGPDDDMYDNDFSIGWDLRVPGGSLYVQNADGYTTLCPGLNKPEEAVRNYDVSYFMRGDTLETPGFRVAGAMNNTGIGDYEQPYWPRGASQTAHIVHIDNEYIPNQYKEIWLLVDYTDRVEDRAQLESALHLIDSNNVTRFPTSITPSADDGQLMFYWRLPDQPEYEEIIFPDVKYFDLAGNVKDWNLTTLCTPEPATIALLGLGGLVMLKRRRR